MTGYDHNAGDTWVCDCGRANTGKFCVICGNPRPAAPVPPPVPRTEWVCACGRTNTGKFCVTCGAPRPVAKPRKAPGPRPSPQGVRQQKASRPASGATAMPPRVNKPAGSTATVPLRVNKPAGSTATMPPRVNKPAGGTVAVPPRVNKPAGGTVAMPPRVNKPAAAGVSAATAVHAAEEAAARQAAEARAAQEAAARRVAEEAAARQAAEARAAKEAAAKAAQKVEAARQAAEARAAQEAAARRAAEEAAARQAAEARTAKEAAARTAAEKATVSQAAEAQATGTQEEASVLDSEADGNNGMLKKVAIGVAVLLLVIGAYFMFGRKKEAPPAPEPPKVETKTETKTDTEKPTDPAAKEEKLKEYAEAVKAANEQKKQDATANEKIVFLVEDVKRTGNDLVISGHFYNGKKNRTITAVKALELDIVLRDMDKELLNEKNIKYEQSFTGMSIKPLKDSPQLTVNLPGKAPTAEFNNFTVSAHDVHWEAVGN